MNWESTGAVSHRGATPCTPLTKATTQGTTENMATGVGTRTAEFTIDSTDITATTHCTMTMTTPYSRNGIILMIMLNLLTIIGVISLFLTSIVILEPRRYCSSDARDHRR